MNYRKQFINWLFEKSQVIYTRYFKKNEPWNITRKELLAYPKASFGNRLGQFLKQHGFDLIPKVERHDCYHVITGYSTKVQDEIALQYLCFGNGKRSLYLFGVLAVGTFILPDYFKYYLKSYRIGKASNMFHSLNFKKLLPVSYSDLQGSLFSKSYLKTIHNNI